MSCIASVSPTGEQIAAAAACAIPLPFSAPPVTETKVRRLLDMSVSKDPKIRAIAAGHPNLPEDAMWELAMDDSELVQGWLLRNWKTPLSIIEHIAVYGSGLAKEYARFTVKFMVGLGHV